MSAPVQSNGWRESFLKWSVVYSLHTHSLIEFHQCNHSSLSSNTQLPLFVYTYTRAYLLCRRVSQLYQRLPNIAIQTAPSNVERTSSVTSDTWKTREKCTSNLAQCGEDSLIDGSNGSCARLGSISDALKPLSACVTTLLLTTWQLSPRKHINALKCRDVNWLHLAIQV